MTDLRFIRLLALFRIFHGVLVKFKSVFGVLFMMDIVHSEAPLTVYVKQNPDVQGICKKTYDVERIITNLRDANLRLNTVNASMKKSGLDRHFTTEVDEIQSKIELSVVQLLALNVVELDLKAFDRQICEKMNRKYKEYEEFQLKRAEKLEREVYLEMEKRFKELHVKYLKPKGLESGSLESPISVELAPVSSFPGYPSAASEEQDALKGERGEENSVPSFSEDHSAASKEQDASKNERCGLESRKISVSLAPVSSFPGYPSAASEEQVALKNESGEKNSALGAGSNGVGDSDRLEEKVAEND